MIDMKKIRFSGYFININTYILSVVAMTVISTPKSIFGWSECPFS